jgi:hypothetical protein
VAFNRPFNYHYTTITYAVKMKVLALICIFFSFQSGSNEKTRVLEIDGAEITTTFAIDGKFIGKYTGSKNGYLLLDNNGNGSYRYDYLGITPDCNEEIIDIKWGFILDENGEVVKFKRDYGYSYPIIYNCIGNNTFQGCTKPTMVDYILVYDDGTITVSSSDDWVKSDN